MSRRDDLHRLIAIHARRLQTLQEQQAGFGTLHTPPHISIEIENTEAELARLRAELAALPASPAPAPTAPPVSAAKPPAAGQPQVFISYSRRDLKFTERLAADLQEAGFAPWWDVSGIPGGETWSRTIEAALEASHSFVIVLSPDSVESKWVKRELAYAESAGLKIIPLLYRDCKKWLELIDLEHIDFRENRYPQGWRKLLLTLTPSTPALPAAPRVREAEGQTGAVLKTAPVFTKLPALARDPLWQMVGVIIAVLFCCTGLLGTGFLYSYLPTPLPTETPIIAAITPTPTPKPTHTPPRPTATTAPTAINAPTVDTDATVATMLTAAAVESAETAAAQPTPPPPTPTSPPPTPTSPPPTPTSPPPTPTSPPPTPTSPPPTDTPAAPQPGAVRTDSKGVPMVYVPAGPFTMGSDNGDSDEKPVHTVTLDAFYIDQYEVTNARYAACVEAGVCSETHRDDGTCYVWNGGEWKPGTLPDSFREDNQPVVCVNWTQAKNYCEWRGGLLPTEAEWEKAARGTDERTYPWGNDFDGSVVNFCDTNCELSHANKDYDDGYADTAPVGSYSGGASPYGALDLAGNVWEWTLSEKRDYPYNSDDGRENLDSTNVRVLRGGSWVSIVSGVRAANRINYGPTFTGDLVGFRCATR